MSQERFTRLPPRGAGRILGPRSQNERSLFFFEVRVPKVSAEHEQRRRQQILDAALACFSRRGYHATSMEDIVREAGLSVGALYTYFPSKEELFLALADTHAEHTLRRLERVMAGEWGLAERLERALDFFFDTLDDEIGPWSRVVLEFLSHGAGGNAVAELERRRCEERRAWLQELLESGVASGECRADLDARATADLLLALSDGLVMHWVGGRLAAPRDELKRAFRILIWHGVLAEARGPSRRSARSKHPAVEATLAAGTLGELQP